LLVAGAPLRRGDVQMVRQLQVPVAARDLNRGETLDAEDISWATMNDIDLAPGVLMDEASIIGRKTKHPIRAGQTMRPFDIARPVAVERGRLVTIQWSTALMNLTVQGIAQESGGVGDVIRVTNAKSKTSLMAEVVDSQTVRVTTGPEPASRETAAR
jgi:flagella basal body P-ring formation protein FlgA